MAGDSAEVLENLRVHADNWSSLARRTFFRSYRKAMGKDGLLPAEASSAEAMLTLFMAEKLLAAVQRDLERHANAVCTSMRRLARLVSRKA